MVRNFKKIKVKEISYFTLIEMMITLIIISILAVIGAVSYYKAIEKSKSRYAESNLISIYNAQKRYKLDAGNYYHCDGSCSDKIIRENLGVDLVDLYFTYVIKNTADGFTATATRNKGHCSGKTMSVNQDTSEPVKNCSIW